MPVAANAPMWRILSAMAKKKATKKGSAKKTPAKKAVRAKRAAAPKSSTARSAKKKATRKPAAKPAKKARAATKKKAPVRAKAPARQKARVAKAKAARARPTVRRRDGAGHLDPKYARELLEKSGPPEVEDTGGFVGSPRSKDALVEGLGEEFVQEVTSAEHEGEDVLDQEVPEDRGGPFVETTGKEEFGYGTDPSNPKGAKREPFPTT